ncbi:MAG: type II secretion system inner membrane protein GspF [Nitrospirota bacterium]|jgi:general secretion pathway protein F
MPVYTYEGLNAAGRRVKGVEDGDSPIAVRNKLRKQGIFPTDVAEERGGTSATQTSTFARLNVELFARVSQHEIALCVRQLGTLLRAGMPLVSALNGIIEQLGETRLARILTLVREAVNGGASLADALAAHPRTFNPLMVNMIRAGETGGALDVVLERLADLMERQASLRRKVQSALVYPAVLLVLGISVVSFLLVKVVPSVTKIFVDMEAELPTATTALLAISDFAQHRWWLVVLGVAAVVFGVRAYGRTDKGRMVLDGLKLKVPLFGGLLRKVMVTRFASTLSTLLASGVPLLSCLEIVRSIVLNRVLQEAIRDVRGRVQEGGAIAPALRATGQFPPIVLHMVDVGEKSGTLEEMLQRMAESYDEEVTVAASAITALVEPLMIVVLGLLVLFIVLAILLPIFEINELIR